MKILKLLFLIFAALLVLSASSLFIVMDYEGAVVTRLGKPVREIQRGGLYWKFPWPVETVHIIDKRLNHVDARIDEALTRDRRNVVIPVYAVWRVADVRTFFEKLGSVSEAATKIESVLISKKNSVIAAHDFADLVSADNEVGALSEIERLVLEGVKSECEKLFGIEILTVGFRQITLPAANTESVFERMRAERARAASSFRAEGQRRAMEIRAEAEASRVEILARAHSEAAAIRGRGDAEAVAILREAYAKDPALYEFVRELEVLEKVVSPETILVLGTDSPPFRMITQDPEAR